VLEAARQRNLQLTVLQIQQISFVSARGSCGVYYQGHNLVEEFDALIGRTFFPNISEALTVARLFHEAGKPVIDRSLIDEGYVISKMHDYLLLAQQGLPVPRTWQLFSVEDALQVAQEIGFPCVLKGTHGSHGSHVFLVETPGQLRERFQTYAPGDLMLQEYLPAEEDYRLLVIGYSALGQMVGRKPGAGDFRTNVGFSGDSCSLTVADRPGLAALAEQAARALRREFAGVDIRYHGSYPYILEVNRQPMFENFERTTGVDVAGQYLDYAISSFRRAAESPSDVKTGSAGR
jgi:RimK family alpha-L-glutamate ligase